MLYDKLLYFLIGLLITMPVAAQTPKEVLKNGHFELGLEEFSSDYQYNEVCAPGNFSLTKRAVQAYKDFLSVQGGDHTSGYGFYLVANADGESNKRIWYTEVTVVPNALYSFETFFCNVFKLQPPKTNFDFETADLAGNDPVIRVKINGEIIAEEKDFYHLYRWVRCSAEWYSGGYSGKIVLSIENTNTSRFGNDIALDDISFKYIQTMPTGYVAPKYNSMAAKEYKHHITPEKRSWLELKSQQDSVGQGVYTLHQKPKPKKTEIKGDSIPIVLPQRVVMKDLMFVQSKADLLPEARNQLDMVVLWLQKDTTVRIRFIGHTDNVGDPVLNIKLSEDRVAAVKNYLVSKGIAADRIETIGYGGAYPIADNYREETRRLNRRVEMEIIEPKK